MPDLLDHLVESRIHQYDALKADVRDLDKLIWGTPSISAAITGVILDVVFSKGLNNTFLQPEARFSILAIGALLNFALFHGLTKHRFFQVYKNSLINRIENQLPMIQELKGTEDVYKSPDNWLHGTLRGKPAYLSLELTQASLCASLIAALAYISLSDNSVIAVLAFVLTVVVLYILARDP